jgi:hypothetical protein
MIKINDKEYKEAEITFNNICALEDMGCSIQNILTNTFSSARAYLALCMGGNKNAMIIAGNEIEEHIKKGGELTDLLSAFAKAIEESGFFQALNKKAEKNTQKE